MGHLGYKRTFFIIPKGMTDMYRFSDLYGITYASYDPEKVTNNPKSALGNACYKITQSIKNVDILPSYYYLSRYPENVQKSLLSNLISDSPFTFEYLLKSCKKEIFLAAQNHHYLLVKNNEKSKNFIFNFLEDDSDRRVRILLCDPNIKSAIETWSFVTSDAYHKDLLDAITEAAKWNDDAKKKGINLEIRATKFVPISLTIIDPKMDTGSLVFTPNMFEHIAGMRACYYLSKKENKDIFMTYYHKYDTVFMRAKPIDEIIEK